MATTSGQARTEWAKLDMGGTLPTNLDPLLSSVNTTIDSITPILDLASAALNILSALPDLSDPLQATLDAVVDTVVGILEVFENTEIFLQSIVPTSVNEATNVEGMLNQIANSFTDSQDPNRPIPSSSDEIAMITVIIVAPDIPALVTALQPALTFFGLPSFPEFNSTTPSEFEALGGTYPPTLTAGEGQDPDWKKQTLSNIGSLSELIAGLKKVTSNFTKLNEGSAFLKTLTSVLSKKVEELRALAESLSSSISTIQGVIESASNIITLESTNTGDVSSLVEALKNSTKDQTNPFLPLGGEEKAASISFAVMSGDLGVITSFRNLFSMGSNVITEVQEIGDETIQQIEDLQKSAEDLFEETF